MYLNRIASNVATGKRSTLCHICHIFKRNILAFYLNYIRIQFTKINHIANSGAIICCREKGANSCIKI